MFLCLLLLLPFMPLCLYAFRPLCISSVRSCGMHVIAGILIFVRPWNYFMAILRERSRLRFPLGPYQPAITRFRLACKEIGGGGVGGFCGWVPWVGSVGGFCGWVPELQCNIFLIQCSIHHLDPLTPQPEFQHSSGTKLP